MCTSCASVLFASFFQKVSEASAVVGSPSVQTARARAVVWNWTHLVFARIRMRRHAWPATALLAALALALWQHERANTAALRAELTGLREAAAAAREAAAASRAADARRLSQQQQEQAEPTSEPAARPGRHRGQELAELLGHVDPAFQEACRQILTGEPTSFAQAWQDWWLYHNLFKRRHGGALKWGRGFYVELGVWNPIFATNTLFFDKCLGWRGVCIEPNSQWWPSIRANRSCTLLPNCVAADNSTTYELIRGGPSGGTARIRPSAHSSARPCVVLGDALRRLGLGEQQIDLLSIDVEGKESEVLRCFDFEKHKPAAVTTRSSISSTPPTHPPHPARAPHPIAMNSSRGANTTWICMRPCARSPGFVALPVLTGARRDQQDGPARHGPLLPSQGLRQPRDVYKSRACGPAAELESTVGGQSV